MATNQKRHTCIKCGRKLIETKMELMGSRRNCVRRHWKCQSNCSNSDTFTK